MPSNTNVNNNSAVVVVGRTAPVPTGQQSAAKSIPVVVASDQEAIPVEEQNKQQSEVALSLLGIPRSEVALGIFADVNTYDVNPSEWSAEPVQLKTILANERDDFAGFQGQQDWGLSHVPAEAGALIEAPSTEYSVLTSKRFFRYQPGRVSAGTFGVKFGRAPITTITNSGDYPSSVANNQVTYMMSELNKQVRHPSIKKYGVFDNFDGYYYESINESRGDNLCCVRRTQSLIQQKSKTFFYDPADDTNPKQYGSKQYDDYGNFELPGIYYKYHGDAVILRDGLVNIHAGLFDPSLLKEKREIDISQIRGNDTGGEIILDTVEYEISNFQYNNVTGRATVTTVGDHGFKDGDSVTLKDILLSCNTGQKLYPNKYSRKIFRVKSRNGNNVTVNVGVSDYDGVGAQPLFNSTSFSGGQLSTISLQSFPTKAIANIDRIAGGILEITLAGTHDYIEGDLIQLHTNQTWNNGSNFQWPNAANSNGYNRQEFYQVRRVKNNRIIQIAIGDAAFSSLPDNATYVSGGDLRKRTYTKPDTFDISSVSYTPSSGDLVLNMGSNASNFSAGDRVEIANIETKCSYNVESGESSHTAANPVKVYPAKDDEDTFPISNVTSNSFTIELFQSTIVHTYVSGGRVSNLGLRKGSSVYYYKNGRSTNGVDGGIYYVHDIVGPKVKLTLVPTNGDDTGSSVFAQTKLVPIEFNTDTTTDKYQITASNIVYDATNGNLTVTSNGHGLDTGDKVRFDDFSIGLTCDSVFASTTAYGLGQFVRSQASVDGARLYKVTVAGTSGASAPTHTSGTATNGSVTFEFVEEFTYSTANVKYYPRPSNSSPAAGLPPLDPASGKFLNVTRINANQFRIESVLTTAASSHTYGHTFVYASPNSITVEKTRPYIVTPAPFILPDTVNGQYSGTYNAAEPDVVEDWTLNAFGCFPYKYTYGNTTVGYVGTDVAATSESGAASIRNDIDFVNNNLLKDWIYNHVKPQYWPVYEYRVPRSRFSGEKIDGQENQGVLYSDVVYSSGSQKFPGEEVIDTASDAALERTSSWNLNPENVTMYKIEFSWYGAVGALFLAYVPLDSGEARWVRVHHLRASNQLKVSSLGNPTLPITYMVYGGGTERSYGYINNSKQENYIAGSSSRSEFLVKYGASYYIDGGDRGTVRLFNYATPTTESVYGSRLNFNISSNRDKSDGSDNAGDYAGVPYIDLTGATVAGTNQLSVTDYTFYMGATVVTPNRDPGVKVVWVDSSTQRVYLNRALPSAGGGNYSLILDRPKVLIGLKCREEVNSVRNRIQVYPTRLSIGNSGAFSTIKLVKSPVFQTEDVVNGNFTTTYDKGSALNIGSIGKPVALDSTKVQNLSFLDELGSTFGYFRGFYDGDSENEITIFGKLQRDASGVYLFNANEKTNINLLIFGDFLRAGEFYEPNPTTLSIPTTYSPSDTPLAALSAISISTEQRTPIPGTGQQITTLYTPANSGEQFELQQFFDYNKDYLSFPLTNEIETLFVLGSESNTYNNTAAATTITAAVTWEEQ